MNSSKCYIVDKFPCDYFRISRMIPFDDIKNNMEILNIYCSVILYSLNKPHGQKELFEFLDNLYLPSFGVSFDKYNDHVFYYLYIGMINKKYLPKDENIFEELLGIAKNIFYSSTLEIDEEFLQKKKIEVLERIIRRDKTPGIICSKKCLYQIDPENENNLDLYGDKDKIQAINKEDILKFHNFLKKYPFSIIYQGENNFNQFEKVKEVFPNDYELPIYVDRPFKKIEEINNSEEFDTPNTYLKMAFGFSKEYSLHNNMIERIACEIIGGSHSILYDVIREEKGLCYSIGSLLYASENVFTISTQVAKKNIKKAIASIKYIMNNIEDYSNIQYFNDAKSSLRNELLEIDDSAGDLFSHIITGVYKRNYDYDFNKSLDALESVTYEEVINFIKTFKCESIYTVIGVNKNVR